jgi:hypothetical protein
MSEQTIQQKAEQWLNCEPWSYAAPIVRDLLAALAAADTQVQTLAKAVTPTHAADWPVEQIATLAEAHRQDSEALDQTAAPATYCSEVDHDAANLQRQTRLQKAEAQLASLSVRVRELEKQLAITSLSVPLEEDLSNRIDEMLKYLAMEDGFTLNGIARLLVDVQRRMADDWLKVGRARRELNQLASLSVAKDAAFNEGWRAGLSQARAVLSRHQWDGQLDEIIAVVDALHEREP